MQDSLCRPCGRTLPCTDFSADTSTKSGRDLYCKECRNRMRKVRRSVDIAKARQAERVYRQTHPRIIAQRLAGKQSRVRDPRRFKNYALKQRYGISLEQLEYLLLKQGDGCGICRCPLSLGAKRLEEVPRVDHNHVTGAVRGALCGGCNSGLGKLKESSYIIQAAQDYLRRDSTYIDHKVRSFSYTSVPDRRRQNKNRSLKFHYQIGIQGYDWLVLEQSNLCGICQTGPKIGHSLGVDHNHNTGQIRGLLCNLCNRGLGYFRDSIPTLQRAIQYLEYYG